MKIATLLAGVAAVALSAGAASADPIFQGSMISPVAISVPNVLSMPANQHLGNVGQLNAAAGLRTAGTLPADISLITISGGSAANNGTASNTDGATFTLKGAVSTDCAYYTGNVNTTIDFGTIGIYASDNTGPANAFDMTAPANVVIDTNLAGCNTSNTVTVSKNDIRGMVNNSSAGYDSNVFQAELPYSVAAIYTAGAVGSVAPATNGTKINLSTAATSTSAQHGAWKSAMQLNVNVPVPSKSLLAGNYQGDLTVSITAF